MQFYASLSRRFIDFLDWFIPEDLKANEESKRRIRTFLVSHVAGPPFGAVVAGYLVYLNPNVAAWGLAAGVVLFVAFPFLLRWTGRYEEVALASLLHFIVLIFFVAYSSGGVASGALPWALTVPIVCVFFVGRLYRLIGFVALGAGFMVVTVPFMLGIELPDRFEASSGGVNLVLLLAAAGYITVMALAYINLYEFSIERLRWAKEVAESANKAKSEFLATMSHELRTPLNAVIGFSQIMSTQALGPIGNPRYLEYSRDIERSGLHLLEIISDILDIAKIESGRFDVAVDVCEPTEVVGRALRIVEPIATQAAVQVSYKVNGDLPRLVGDERLLRQVVINLLTNAIKFSLPGCEVVVRAWCDRGPSAQLCIAVEDEGCGISEGDLDRILQPFEQVESALSRKHGGLGLGLPLSKRVVELHGGTLQIESTLGIGTCVTIRLPLKPQQPMKTSAPRALTPDEPKSDTASAGRAA